MQRLLVVAALLASARAAGDSGDLAALRALKSSITNWATVSPQGWIKGWQGDDPCTGGFANREWTGVTCRNGRVTRLNLAFLGAFSLEGSLPAELDQLTAATDIDATGQAFSSELPASWGADGGFASLQRLRLGMNQLKGSLPSEWGSSDRFQKLQDLELWGNKLTGSVPASWSAEGSFPALFTLLAQDNQLSGSLPSRAEKALASLQNINVSGNKAMDSKADKAWSTIQSIWRKVSAGCGLVSDQPSSAVGQPQQVDPLKPLWTAESRAEGRTARKLLQLGDWERCLPGDEHCTTSKDGNTNVNTFTTSTPGSGNQEDYKCQVSADGLSKSCSYSSSSSSPSGSGSGSSKNNAAISQTGGSGKNSAEISQNTQSQDSQSVQSTQGSSSEGQGFWGHVGSAASTWWVWVLLVAAVGIALVGLLRKRNVYVMLRGDSGREQMGLPRFSRGKDSKEAELY